MRRVVRRLPRPRPAARLRCRRTRRRLVALAPKICERRRVRLRQRRAPRLPLLHLLPENVVRALQRRAAPLRLVQLRPVLRGRVLHSLLQCRRAQRQLAQLRARGLQIALQSLLERLRPLALRPLALRRGTRLLRLSLPRSPRRLQTRELLLQRSHGPPRRRQLCLQAVARGAAVALGRGRVVGAGACCEVPLLHLLRQPALRLRELCLQPRARRPRRARLLFYCAQRRPALALRGLQRPHALLCRRQPLDGRVASRLRLVARLLQCCTGRVGRLQLRLEMRRIVRGLSFRLGVLVADERQRGSQGCLAVAELLPLQRQLLLRSLELLVQSCPFADELCRLRLRFFEFPLKVRGIFSRLLFDSLHAPPRSLELLLQFCHALDSLLPFHDQHVSLFHRFRKLLLQHGGILLRLPRPAWCQTSLERGLLPQSSASPPRRRLQRPESP